MIVIEGPNGIREVSPGVPYRLSPGEKVTSATKDDILSRTAKTNRVPLGDMIAKVFDSTGFKAWYNKQYGEGDGSGCAPCKKRQAALNYIEFQGPKWLSKWVKDNSG